MPFFRFNFSPSRTSVPQDRGIHLRLHHYCHRKEAEAWVVYPANVDHEQAGPAIRRFLGSCLPSKHPSPGKYRGNQTNCPVFFWVPPEKLMGNLVASPVSYPNLGSLQQDVMNHLPHGEVVPHHCRSKRSGLWTDRLLQRRVARYHRVVQELNWCVWKISKLNITNDFLEFSSFLSSWFFLMYQNHWISKIDPNDTKSDKIFAIPEVPSFWEMLLLFLIFWIHSAATFAGA